MRFHDSRCGDANHSAMPSFAVHNYAIRFVMQALPPTGAKYCPWSAFFSLPLRIRFNPASRRSRVHNHISLIEEFDHIACHIHTSGGIQTSGAMRNAISVAVNARPSPSFATSSKALSPTFTGRRKALSPNFNTRFAQQRHRIRNRRNRHHFHERH